MARHLVVSAVALCVLSACSSPAQWTPGPIVTETATTVATTPSASPTSSGTATTPTTPAVPDAAGATDVSSFDFSDFASPSGRIWCGLRSDLALCHFPYGMKGKVPSSSTVCPGEGLDVTGVSVDAQGKAEYFCSGDPEAFPQTSSESVGWWKPTGYPSVKYNGFTLAVLPYGKRIANAAYVCISEKVGVTCGNTLTGKGFRVALAGVTFIG